ncbi:MAG: hypothetical protein WCF26_16480 [Candidatus Sulfotelmatobacter sp.]
MSNPPLLGIPNQMAAAASGSKSLPAQPQKPPKRFEDTNWDLGLVLKISFKNSVVSAGFREEAQAFLFVTFSEQT